ncbi:SHOCT domain-containing protein [Streptomyces noursei]|uniref:SHOCT domain-containing protein n=1 Tax=Streptomyces noursei TaxID=1971 RepID=UPI001966B3F2|nr:SHOCT domain-containing protein [Streptomyces noursei]QRX91085.1 SHOCT domain-containing protein [Streptomyces noursei]
MNALAEHWSGGGPGPWILFVPLVWAAVAFGAVTLLRRTVWRHGGPGRAFLGPWPGPRPAGGGDTPTPIAVLGRRFAAGEIDEEEYWRRLSVLEEHFGSGRKGSAAA